MPFAIALRMTGDMEGMRVHCDLSPTSMALTPPSTNSRVPAMKSESSDTRNRMARAMSSGTPEQQAADIDQEETKWGALVHKLGLRAE